MRFTIVAMALGVALLAGQLPAAAAPLVTNGQPTATIYHAPISAKPMARTFAELDVSMRVLSRNVTQADAAAMNAIMLATAIDDLQYHIEKITGITLPVVETDDPAAVKAPAIVIGPLAEAMGATPTAFEGNPEAYRILTRDNLVLIAGRGTYHQYAAAHGIYALLNQLGCHWVFPGLEGEVIPQRNSIIVDNQDTQSAPAFNPRHAWYGGMQRDNEAQFEFLRWLLRMRMQPNRLLIGDAMHVGGHVSTDRFNDFWKQVDEGIENPPAIQEAIELIRKRFEDNGWPNDKRVCIPMGPATDSASRIGPTPTDAPSTPDDPTAPT